LTEISDAMCCEEVLGQMQSHACEVGPFDDAFGMKLLWDRWVLRIEYTGIRSWWITI